MKLRFTTRSIADIEAIADYIKARDPKAALKVEQAIATSIGHLCEHPNLGVERRNLGVRALAMPRYPYTIYYRADPETVVIVHVRHGARYQPGNNDLPD